MTPTRYFHGAAFDLELPPGSFLLPSAETGAESLAQWVTSEGDRRFASRPDRVYFTSDPNIAAMFASMRATRESRGLGGHVYEVVPLGAVELDPDYTPAPGFPNASWQAPRARVVRCVRRNVPLSYGLYHLGLA